MEDKRGQIFDFTTTSGVKKCLIVSGNKKLEKIKAAGFSVIIKKGE